MDLLLDSNALIWWVTDNARLSRRAYAAIESEDNRIFVSLVSLWEITIKIARGRLPQFGSSVQYLLDEVDAQKFELLPLRPADLPALGALGPYHRDPFDRMLIAQSLASRLPIVTSDPFFPLYLAELFR